MKARLTKNQFITLLKAQEIAYNLMRASDEEHIVECSYGNIRTTQQEFNACMSIITGAIENLVERISEAEEEQNKE